MFGRLDKILRDEYLGRLPGMRVLRMHSTAIETMKQCAYTIAEHPGVWSATKFFGLDILPDDTLDEQGWALVKVEYWPDPERLGLAVIRVETVVETGLFTPVVND